MRHVLAALALTACLASSISRQSAGSSQVTQGELDHLLDRWQSRLELSAWTVQASLVPANSLDSEGNEHVTVADIAYDHDDLTATIRIEQSPPEQIEESLVHELVHLQLEAWHSRQIHSKRNRRSKPLLFLYSNPGPPNERS